MFGLGTTELIIIGVIIIFLFGAKRIPEIGRGLGQSLKEFNKVKKDLEQTSDANDIDGENGNDSILGKTITGKVIDQVPVVKKAVDINKKVNIIKKIIS